MDLADCSHHTASSRHHTIFCVQDKPFAEMVAAKSTKSTHSTSSSTRLRLRIVKTLNGWKLLKWYEVTDPWEELPDFNACDCFRTRPLNGRGKIILSERYLFKHPFNHVFPIVSPTSIHVQFLSLKSRLWCRCFR